MRRTSCIAVLLTLLACDTNTSGIIGIANGGGGGSGTANHLGFTMQPTNTATGSSISQVQVAALSSSGVTDTTFTLAIGIGLSNPGGASLGGTDTVSAVRGVAVFQNLIVSGSGTGVRLTANASGVTGATSATFNVQ